MSLANTPAGSTGPASTPDVAPLAWVIDEVRSSLGAALSSVKAFLGNKTDIDQLRSAREHVHQVSGALQLLDLRGVTNVTESIEQLFALWEKEPGQCLPAAVRAVEATLGAVRNFLDGMLAGRLSPPIRLFPYYREILVLLRAPRMHPADLVFPDLTRRPAFHQMEVRALSNDELRIRRVKYEEGLLRFLRDPENPQARARMREAVFELEALPQRGLARSFWWVARALFDALDSFQLPVDAELKRFLARLNQQLRRQIEGGPAVAERLMIDALYHVGRADDRIERVAQVKQLYGLTSLIPPDFDRASLTTIDTESLAALREALSQAKLLWGQIMASDKPDPARLRAEVARAQASAQRLGAPAPARVLGCIGDVTANLAALSPTVRSVLGMEIAGALLLLETGSEGFPQSDPLFDERADAMIERIVRASQGKELPEGDAWISELARRAQDRLSMDTVVAEMSGMLREAELRLDRFFRNPAKREELAELDPMFEQVAGVLDVLGYADPAAALRNVRAAVHANADPANAPDTAAFVRIAQNLGAVGFFVGELGQNPSQPRGNFHFDAKTGVLSAEMGVAPAVPEVQEEEDWASTISLPPESPVAAPADTAREARAGRGAGETPAVKPSGAATPAQPAPIELMPVGENVEAAIERLMAEALGLADRIAFDARDRASMDRLAPILGELLSDVELTDDATLRERLVQATQLLEAARKGKADAPRALQSLLRPETAAIPAPTAPMPTSASAADEELHEIFVEEADEVLESITAQLARLHQDPSDSTTLTMTRRAFHTLKGSSRMVGLKEFGEFAWALEQCFNVWIAQERPATEDLLRLAGASADCMRDWIEQLRTRPDAQLDVSAFIAAAHIVRDGGSFALPEGAGAGAMDGGAPDASGTAGEPGEDMRRIGPLSISHGLYSVFLNESDECVRALAQDIGEWRYEPAREVSEAIVRRAHTLAGITDTVGLAPVCALADPLDALMQILFERRGREVATLDASQFDVLERSIERMRGMLHQFAGGVFPDEAPLEAGALSDLVTMLRARAAAPTAQAAAAPEDSGFPDTIPGPLVAMPAELPAFAPAPAPAPAPIAAPAPPVRAATPPAPVVQAVPRAAPSAPTPAPTLTPAPAPAPAATITAPAMRVVPPPAPPVAPRVAAPASAEAVRAPLLAGSPPPAPLVVVPEDLPSEPVVDLPEQIRDDIDPQLFEVFSQEAQDLLPDLARNLRALVQNPNQRELARELMRNLHTLKGSARMAGAMRLGEVVHQMEERIESAMQLASVPAVVIEDLQGQYDHALGLFEEVGKAAGGTAAPGAVSSNMASTLAAVAGVRPGAVAGARTAAAAASAAAAPGADGRQATAFIRVRADLVDKLVDHAGEVSIARSKLEAEVGSLRGSLTDLTENIQRLRSQLREVEMQADAQLQARSDQVAKQSSSFDPLEFDRYSRLQELTRLLAESVEDVALVQSSMLKGLTLADNDLSAQSRLTRELQQQLMRVRLVPFSSVSERLYRVARQAAKEMRKHVHLDILGGETEMDRSLLEAMAGPFEHLVRNAIVHGLELPTERLGAGKSETGELRIEVRREGNEIVAVFADDGAGIDLERLRSRAVSSGRIAADRKLDERELIDLIFLPGLSTAREVTELAGRGVGMDVVREEVATLGGRIAVVTDRGRGARFTLYLPMTLSILQVVLASVGERRYALPAAMVEQARRVRTPELAQAIQAGSIAFAGVGEVTLRPLSQLVGAETVIGAADQYSVALLRLGDDRLAICADDLSANQEVVVKNVGPQVARLAGVLGATVLGNGQVVLIVNPVQLIGHAPEPPALDTHLVPATAQPGGSGAAARLSTVSGATIMVVDDSLTVRRVTQRLLDRNGFRTVLAKDGLDALRELEQTVPDVMLVDIEMPRMDGYELTRSIRANEALRNIPIIMITSRTAEKHRRVAFDLGVNEYLGKPYKEDELIELIRRYVETARALRDANAGA